MLERKWWMRMFIVVVWVYVFLFIIGSLWGVGSFGFGLEWNGGGEGVMK